MEAQSLKILVKNLMLTTYYTSILVENVLQHFIGQDEIEPIVTRNYMRIAILNFIISLNNTRTLSYNGKEYTEQEKCFLRHFVYTFNYIWLITFLLGNGYIYIIFRAVGLSNIKYRMSKAYNNVNGKHRIKSEVNNNQATFSFIFLGLLLLRLNVRSINIMMELKKSYKLIQSNSIWSDITIYLIYLFMSEKQLLYFDNGLHNATYMCVKFDFQPRNVIEFVV